MEIRECCDCGHKYDAKNAYMNKVWDGDLQVHITHEVCPECLAQDYYLKGDKK